MGEITEGIRNQYLTYPFKVKRPFGKYKVGQSVKAVDVAERGDSYMIMFEDGSALKLSKFDQYLTIADGFAEPPLLDGEIKNVIKPEVGNFPAETKFPMKNSEVAGLPPRVEVPVKKAHDTSYFTKFNSEVREFYLNLDMKLPDPKFLEAMYDNAANKEEFLNELSSYVLSSINKEVIAKSVKLMFEFEKEIKNNEPK